MGREEGHKYKKRLAHSGLTVEKEAYCRARAMGMSVVESLKAINSTSTKYAAYKWEEEQEVVDRINHLSKLAQNNAIIKSGLDREWVISRYMTIVDRCMQTEPVRDKDGNNTGEYTFNASSANTALRALGDVLGLFKPPEKKPGDDYENLSDDELARIAQDLAGQTGLLENFAGTQAQAGCEQAGEVQAVPKAD